MERKGGSKEGRIIAAAGSWMVAVIRVTPTLDPEAPVTIVSLSRAESHRNQSRE